MFNKPEADVRAVSDIDLEVRSGEIMAVMGPNGAGKTTLVKMLCTLLLPTSGEAQVRGIDVCRNPDAVRRQIAYITGDERSFYWRLSGRQNLQFFGGLNGLSSTELKTKIHTTCEALGITDLLDRRFDSYSTGIRQKFAIARGLLNNASVLFLDEPTRSLDPGSSHGLLSILRNDIAKSQNRTVILVTHRLDEAQTTCDRLLVMKNGRCAFLGEPSEFLNLAAFSGWQIEVKDFSDQAMDALKRLPLKSVYHTDTPLDKKGTEKQAALQVETIPETDLSIGDIAAVLVSHGARVTDITKMIQKPSDVFADLVEEDESGEAES